MDKFTSSSQFKNWQYSSTKLQEINMKLFKSYNTDENLKFSEDIPSCIKKINKVLNIYCNYITSECIRHDLPKSIEGAALIYFKRYYLNKTIIFHFARQTALISLYVACKDERPHGFLLSLAEKLKQNPSNAHMVHYGNEKYGMLEAELLKVLDFDLIVHSVFQPLEYLKKTFSVLDEKYGKKYRAILSFKARCSFHNQWLFEYPPGILALGVFYATLEELGEKNVLEDFFQKDEHVFRLWQSSSNMVQEFIAHFKTYSFDHEEEKKESDKIIALTHKIKSARDHSNKINAFQKPMERGNITKTISRNASIEHVDKRKSEGSEKSEDEPPIEKKLKTKSDN